LKRELQRPKILIGLLVTLALALSLVMAVPVMAQPIFTGDVEADFTGPSVLTFVDPGGQELTVPGNTPPGSGWDIKDLRLAYDPATHILYVGVNSYNTVGDADSDGDDATATYGGGVDIDNLGGTECVSVYFDLDQDGTYDVIAGVPADGDISDFSVNVYAGSWLYFGAQLATHIGTVYYNPDAGHPDFEFTILDFDGLPNQDGQLGAFNFGAFMGSLDDLNIGEDFLVGSTSSPAINIVKKTNGTDNNSPSGPYIAAGATVTWTYNVTNPGSVPLSNVVVMDDNGTPGNLLDDWSPTYVSGDTSNFGVLDLTEAWIYQASGTAAAGQYANTGTATGYSGGFPVSDTDPDHYFGSGPCIHIEKSTNGLDADNPTGPTIPVGGAVLWEYVVTNCGNMPLSSITVTDSEAGVTPAYVSGDTGNFGFLDLTETWIYQANGTATAGQYANTGNVTGTPPVGSPVSDDDPSHYFGSAPTPDIHIEKYTNGVDADTAPGPNINIGSTVTWTYRVTNTGDVNLTGILVTDNKPGVTPAHVSGDTSNFGVLDLTETWIYQATGVAVAGQYANIGTVVGYYGAVGVTDTDPSHYFGKTVPTVGWETYPINKLHVLLPWIALFTAIIVGASLLVLRHRRAHS